VKQKNMQADHQVSHVLSCNTCHLTFTTSAEMREHYKTNLHRFNLKRKGAGLRPVSEALFDKKLAGVFSNFSH
jgi:pre-60S factor REI1